MWIERMRIEDVRILQSVDLRLLPGLNLFIGANGAGKTSLLEAAHLLGYGRSFRTAGREALVRRGTERARVVADLKFADGVSRRLGIERSGPSWRGRVDDEEVAQLSALFRLCAVCCFEPGSHELISGPADGRRAMLDWGVFHVEPDFLSVWRRYQKALRQRNALIREQAPDAWFAPWEQEMAIAAARVGAMRQRYAAELATLTSEIASELLPEFTGAQFALADGWKAESTPDAAAAAARLASERVRDRERGFTRRGPHRADWSLLFDQIPRREHFSRGQEKLVALIAVLAQLSSLQRLTSEWPVLLLDDLASELDAEHQARVFEWLQRRPIQVLMTGVAIPPWAAADQPGLAVFHVEHGRVEAHH